ncbi:tryptophan synthase subunit alpha [Pedobacter sp. ASV1-7]|uniref:tryptophan synthase subunit alpha n=1 Tax=Pedobacter sp. ASV1-7 TaxID=3145237 RepID=UPI0032E8CDF2
MSRIKELFETKKNILSIYYTAGYPGLNDTVTVAEALEQNGAQIIEVGFPYSDPVADGPIIQASSKQSLDQGMDLKTLFEQLKDLRKRVNIPVVLMGYFNTVLQFGVENFCKACVEVGVDGCIVPDLPIVEYEELYQPIFEKYGISNIFLVTPQTSPERIRKIDAISTGFIYLVSSSATTGQQLQLSENTEGYFSRIADMKLKNPMMTGFGIYNKETFDKACQYANGAIIGSAFVKVLDPNDLTGSIKSFMTAFKP